MVSHPFRGASRSLACLTLVVASFAIPTATRAQGSALEGHLPIVDITPVTSFTTTGNAFGLAGDPFSTNGSLANGSWQLDGSVTLPIYHGLALTYEKNDASLVDASLQGVAIPGRSAYGYPGSSRDLLQHYYIGQRIGHHWDFHLGLGSRTRLCCPAGNDPSNPTSFEWHQGYLSATYITSPIRQLLDTTLVLSETGLTSNHHPSPAALAAEPPGLDIGNGREFATTQVASAIVPIGRRSGLVASATFVWGAFDTYENGAFPWYYDSWFFSATKTVNPYVAFTLRSSIGTQRDQGNPEPSPNVIKASSLEVLADFHLDFNRILGSAAGTRAR